MRNKYVGAIVIGISLLIGFLIYIFNRALSNIVDVNCSHGPSCPMWGTINFQTNIGIAILVFLLAAGFYLMFFSKDEPMIREVHKRVIVREQVKPRKIDKDNYSKILNALEHDDRIVFEKIISHEGSIFQSQLVDELEYTKVKITRILDRLEGKGLIERKRRGMTNIVLLKH